MARGFSPPKGITPKYEYTGLFGKRKKKKREIKRKIGSLGGREQPFKEPEISKRK